MIHQYHKKMKLVVRNVSIFILFSNGIWTTTFQKLSNLCIGWKKVKKRLIPEPRQALTKESNKVKYKEAHFIQIVLKLKRRMRSPGLCKRQSTVSLGPLTRQRAGVLPAGCPLSATMGSMWVSRVCLGRYKAPFEECKKKQFGPYFCHEQLYNIIDS